MADPLLTLIAVTHNSAGWLPQFFDSWRKCAFSLPREIIVADSGSTDDTRKVAAEIESSARVMECGNIGYGGAINRAAAVSAAPWLLICNPDLTFPLNFMGGMELSDESGEMVSQCIAPALLNPDGSPQPSVGNFPSIWNLLADQFRHRRKRKMFSLQPQQPCPVAWATGACLLIHRKTFQNVGGFDEKFFLHVEEVDLQRRLRDAHCFTFFCPQMTVIHHAPSASLPPNRMIKRYAARGLLRYFAKHGTFPQLFAYRLLALLSCRLTPAEAFASRKKILDRPTGP